MPNYKFDNLKMLSRPVIKTVLSVMNLRVEDKERRSRDWNNNRHPLGFKERQQKMKWNDNAANQPR